MQLVDIRTPEQIEWLRTWRNNPSLYKYFGQDKGITKEEHMKWINDSRYSKKLFIVEEHGKRVGYAGFPKIDQHSKSAEFGMFILPAFQGKGYGKLALLELLRIGFEELHLSNIKSDVLDYPGEHRFDFYRKIGFEAFSKDCQNIKYQKKGMWIPAIRFFMTKDVYNAKYNKVLECVQ